MVPGTGSGMTAAFGRPYPQQPSKERRGISGSTLKMIAVISMLVDHIAAGVLSRYLHMYGIGSLDTNDTAAMDQWMSLHGTLYAVYMIMRMAGRLAFPIYCFLLAEGFDHTGSRYKYALRLLVFAAVSEIPFDLAFNGRFLEAGYQNVFFTLFCGFVMMVGISQIEKNETMGSLPKQLLKFVMIVSCMAVAQLLRTDYGAIGVLCIAAVFLFRQKKLHQVIAGCVAFSWELTAPFAFIPVWFYNGKRGWKNKYFFYLFYPVHLLLIYIVCVMLGVASYQAG